MIILAAILMDVNINAKHLTLEKCWMIALVLVSSGDLMRVGTLTHVLHYVMWAGVGVYALVWVVTSMATGTVHLSSALAFAPSSAWFVASCMFLLILFFASDQVSTKTLNAALNLAVLLHVLSIIAQLGELVCIYTCAPGDSCHHIPPGRTRVTATLMGLPRLFSASAFVLLALLKPEHDSAVDNACTFTWLGGAAWEALRVILPWVGWPIGKLLVAIGNGLLHVAA